MASDYIATCVLTIGNKKLDDWKDVEEGETEVAKEVKKMSGSGFADLVPSHIVTMTYLVPSAGDEFDFNSVKDGTLTLVDDGGRRTVYTGVRTLKIGAAKRDRENEMTKQITFGAKKKIVD